MKRILLVMLEFDTWEHARAWSYTGCYAFYDGLTQNGHQCTILPAFSGRMPNSPDSFIGAAPRLLKGEKFDEAWVWCVHAEFDEDFWQWLASVAPVRVGVVMESLTHDPDDLAHFPHLAGRQGAVLYQLRHCTHALIADEIDCPVVHGALGIPTAWNVPMVPEERIRHLTAPDHPKGAFIGANYAKRRPYLADPMLAELLERPVLPERESPLPSVFAERIRRTTGELVAGTLDARQLAEFMQDLRDIRAGLFELTLDALRNSLCSVNLPSIIRTYPGRIFEAMAAGTPAVSWRVPERPQCAALFEEGSELALFSGKQELTDTLLRLRDDRKHRERQVISARNTLLARHTSRIRMQQYTRWIAGLGVPDFAMDQCYKPNLEQSLFYRDFFATNPSWSAPAPNNDEQARWQVIHRYLERLQATYQRPMKIVEIGCGRGWLANLCSAYGEVTAVEPVGDVIAHARRTYPHLRFLTGDANLLDFLGESGDFDLLICSEVLEHIPTVDKPSFARSLVRLVRPGGHLIITTPRADIRDAWESAYGKPGQPVEDWLSEDQLKCLFETAGCEMMQLERAFLMDIYQVWLMQAGQTSSLT